MRTALTLILAGALVAITACSSGAAQAPTISKVANTHDLHSCQAISPPTLYASAEATCTNAAGQSIDLAIFNSDQSRDQWLKAAAYFGSNPAFKGDRYAALNQ